MAAAEIHITEYTDPACPWAFSAEPFRFKLMWMYGDQLTWDVRLVGLSDDVSEMEAKGFTPDKLAAGSKMIGNAYGMPMDSTPRERLAASVPACRAVVAARLNAPERAWALLRALRVRNFTGELLDEEATIAGAATDAGLDPQELQSWMADPATESALDEDLAVSRQPTEAARVMDERLADWAGGRRYTCPSYELARVSDGLQLSAPGFQPFRVYDVATANLAPGAARRAKPASVTEVLEWAGTPLATREVAEVCELSDEEAHAALTEAGATSRAVGDSAFWSLTAVPAA